MTTLELIALLTQLLLPLLLIVWVGVRRHRTALTWAVDVAIVTGYLLAIGLAVPWLSFPWYLPLVFGAMLVASAWAGATRIRRDRGAMGPTVLARLGIGVRALTVVALAGVVLLALTGRRRFAEPPAELEFPLRQGTFLVANGGSRQIVNPHLMTLTGERFRPYRGQSYAVDLVKVGSWGSRRGRLSPGAPEDFAIFGDSIHAPCTGAVVRAADGFPDRLPSGAVPETLEGNHVLLECGPVWVLLAHMRQGSVRVRTGEAVERGNVLGLVGNSGRSDEPHLHIHAQTPGPPEARLGGRPVPVTFSGRHLVRNDRVRTE